MINFSVVLSWQFLLALWFLAESCHGFHYDDFFMGGVNALLSAGFITWGVMRWMGNA